MKAADALATLQELGSTQRGLITTSQAEEYGVSRVTLGRLRDRGLIYQARRGVYALPTAEDESLQDLHAAWLSTEPTKLGEQRLHHPDIVVSHISAARVHGLGDLIAPLHEFTATARRRSSQPDVRIHRADLPDNDVAVINGLPVTSIPRTVGDLADGGVDLDHLADVVRDALSAPEVRPKDLARRLDQAAQRNGYTDGNALVEACLERAGLPAVASNLTSTQELLARTIGTDAIRQLVGNALQDLFRDQWKPSITDLAGAMQGYTGLTAKMNLPPQHTAVLAEAMKPLMTTSIQTPALDAIRSSTASELSTAMRRASPWHTSAQDGPETTLQSPSDVEENDGDDESRPPDASGTEHVTQGEADREGP